MTEAVNWLRKATERGHNDAIELLETIDKVDAARKLAEQGNAEAQWYFGIHAILRRTTRKPVQKSRTRKLTPLIAVEKLRLAIVLKRLFKAIDAKTDIHRIAQSPR